MKQQQTKACQHCVGPLQVATWLSLLHALTSKPANTCLRTQVGEGVGVVEEVGAVMGVVTEGEVMGVVAGVETWAQQ